MIVLMYHRFGDNPEDLYCKTRDAFVRDLEQLRRYRVTDPYKMDGDAIITIDDGDKSVYDIACPLLRGYGYCATLFIAPNLIGKEGYMTQDQVKALSKEFCIESHSYNHLPLKPMEEEDIRFELKKSRDEIETWTGRKPKFLSLPGGRGPGDETIIKIAKELGYKGIFTSVPGNNIPFEPYFIKRVMI